MAKKSMIYTDSVAAGSNDIQNFPVIPVGVKWVIDKFGCADIALGDGASSVYILQWGSPGNWETIRLISLTGNTIELDVGQEIEGDGNKYVRLIRQNRSSSNDRELPVWIKAYSRE